MADEEKEKLQHRRQGHVDQRPGGDTPKHRAGTRRRTNESNAAQRPKDDLFRMPAHTPASERVPEFVHQNEREEPQVFIERENG